jgi:ATP-dependent Clp protease protease subunit
MARAGRPFEPQPRDAITVRETPRARGQSSVGSALSGTAASSAPFSGAGQRCTVDGMTDTTPLDDDLARRLLDQRTILLGSVLDETVGNRICSALVMLATEKPTSDIWLWINSPGGSVPAMLAIRDTMRLIDADVCTVNLGMAYSAGQFLLSAGTSGRRYSLAHARVLLHQGSAGFGGVAEDIALQAADLRHTRDTVLRLIAEDTGQPVERVEKDSRRDRTFTASEAVAYGFVDHVVTTLAQIRTPTPRTLGLGVSA